jgi:hypothetical protein
MEGRNCVHETINVERMEKNCSTEHYRVMTVKIFCVNIYFLLSYFLSLSCLCCCCCLCSYIDNMLIIRERKRELTICKIEKQQQQL